MLNFNEYMPEEDSTIKEFVSNLILSLSIIVAIAMIVFALFFYNPNGKVSKSEAYEILRTNPEIPKAEQIILDKDVKGEE